MYDSSQFDAYVSVGEAVNYTAYIAPAIYSNLTPSLYIRTVNPHLRRIGISARESSSRGHNRSAIVTRSEEHIDRTSRTWGNFTKISSVHCAAAWIIRTVFPGGQEWYGNLRVLQRQMYKWLCPPIKPEGVEYL